MVARGWPLFLVLLGAAALSTQPAAGAEGGMSQLDVNKSTIQATMSALPAEDAVLIEFFASWCPACRCVPGTGVRAASQQAAAHDALWPQRSSHMLPCQISRHHCRPCAVAHATGQAGQLHQGTTQGPLQCFVYVRFVYVCIASCRAFKPEYEKAATFLLKHSSVHVYRLDCAVDVGSPAGVPGRAVAVGPSRLLARRHQECQPGSVHHLPISVAGRRGSHSMRWVLLLETMHCTLADAHFLLFLHRCRLLLHTSRTCVTSTRLRGTPLCMWARQPTLLRWRLTS